MIPKLEIKKKRFTIQHVNSIANNSFMFPGERIYHKQIDRKYFFMRNMIEKEVILFDINDINHFKMCRTLQYRTKSILHLI